MFNETKENATEGCLLTSRETAKYLGISERSLWGHTVPRGNLPVVRIGKSVRYAPADIAAFIEAAKNEGVQDAV